MLIFRLKREWWNKIISKEKKHEYRQCTTYWDARLLNLKQYFDNARKHNIKLTKTCFFTLGFPKSGDKIRTRKGIIKNISIIWGKETDLNINDWVYDIEFDLLEERL